MFTTTTTSTSTTIITTTTTTTISNLITIIIIRYGQYQQMVHGLRISMEHYYVLILVRITLILSVESMHG